MEICFYQFPEDWGDETLNAALERGIKAPLMDCSSCIPGLRKRIPVSAQLKCPVNRGHHAAASATLWFYIKNRAQTGVSEEKLLLLLSALSEHVNSYWNPAEEGCQPGSSVRFSADVNQEASIISTELAHNS